MLWSRWVRAEPGPVLSGGRAAAAAGGNYAVVTTLHGLGLHAPSFRTCYAGIDLESKMLRSFRQFHDQTGQVESCYGFGEFICLAEWSLWECQLQLHRQRGCPHDTDRILAPKPQERACWFRRHDLHKRD